MIETVEKEVTIAGVTEFFIGAVTMGATLAGLAIFDVAEGWRVPVILAVSTVYLGVGIALAKQRICGQIWIADPLKSYE